MDEHPAPGLTADWLNAWLAAIGVSVLLPDARLRWTDDPLPQAMFHLPRDSHPLPDRIAAALPTVDDIGGWVISQIDGKVRSTSTYRDLADVARAARDDTLSMMVTDLGDAATDGSLPKAPFDPPVPAGRTLSWRLSRAAESISPESERVAATLGGTAPRDGGNGLGFDYRRIGSGTDSLVEVLAFEGLRLFPVRGDGHRARQRGWTAGVMTRRAFRWPVWSEPLDRWAIDAVLDIAATNGNRVGSPVTGMFGSVPYKVTSVADPTRGYASERIW